MGALFSRANANVWAPPAVIQSVKVSPQKRRKKASLREISPPLEQGRQPLSPVPTNEPLVAPRPTVRRPIPKGKRNLAQLTLGIVTFNEAAVEYKGCDFDFGQDEKELNGHILKAPSFGRPSKQEGTNSNPDILLLCTQESLTNKKNFHDLFACFLGQKQQKSEYILIAQTEPISSLVAEVARVHKKWRNKNVRTSVYMKRALVLTRNVKPLRDWDKKQSFATAACVIQVEQKFIRFRMPAINATVWKAAILTQLQFIHFKATRAQDFPSSYQLRRPHRRDIVTVNVVNAHLYFGDSGNNQGLDARTHDFLDIIDKFKLDDPMTNLIFCGDLNFREDPVVADCYGGETEGSKESKESKKRHWASESRDIDDIKKCAQHVLALYGRRQEEIKARKEEKKKVVEEKSTRPTAFRQPQAKRDAPKPAEHKALSDLQKILTVVPDGPQKS